MQILYLARWFPSVNAPEPNVKKGNGDGGAVDEVRTGTRGDRSERAH